MADEVPVVAQGDVTETPLVNAEEPVVANQEGGDDDPQATETTGEQKPKKLGGWQRKQLKAEAEAEYWRNVALESLQNKPKVEAKPEVTEDKRPQKADFIVDKEAQTYDPDAYEEALLAWNRRQTSKEVLAEIEKREQAKTQKSEQQKQVDTWSQKFKEAKDSGEFEDIEEVFNTTPIAPDSHVAKFLLKNASTIGVQIGYHLGTHPEELQAIQKMPLDDALVALGELKASVKAQLASKESAAEKEDKPAPQQVTKAPPPPDPVRKAAPANHFDVNDDKTPIDQWMKARSAQVLRKK
jgi:hypothetical protein